MAKCRASRRLRFEDTKRIISPEIRPKRFGTFEKQADMPTHLADKVGYHFDLLKRERTQMLWKVAKVKKITVRQNELCKCQWHLRVGVKG